LVQNLIMPNIYVKNSGVWSAVSQPYVNQAGTFTPVKAVYIKDAGSWKIAWPDNNVEYLVVAGGGGGGPGGGGAGQHGAGGGAWRFFNWNHNTNCRPGI